MKLKRFMCLNDRHLLPLESIDKEKSRMNLCNKKNGMLGQIIKRSVTFHIHLYNL